MGLILAVNQTYPTTRAIENNPRVVYILTHYNPFLYYPIRKDNAGLTFRPRFFDLM